MSQFLPRALPSFRTAVLRTSHAYGSNDSRLSLLPISQTRCLTLRGQAPYKRHGRNSKLPSEKLPVGRPPVQPPSKSSEELAQLPYLVNRTPSLQVPVYRKWSSGNMRQTILIRKIHGDRRKMVDDLIRDLQLSKEEVRLNPTTQNIELKGDQFNKAKDWLLQSGF